MKWLKGFILQGLILLCYCIGAIGALIILACMIVGSWLYKFRGWPEEAEALNCIAYAVPMWLKDPENTYMIVRKSPHTMMPRTFFAESIEGINLQYYKPNKPKRGIAGFFHSMYYDGYVKYSKGEHGWQTKDRERNKKIVQRDLNKDGW
jgi:hypothetical protein